MLASLLSGLSPRCTRIFYINGPETLPAPLKAAEEAECLKKLVAGDPEGREMLIVHNLRLVVYIAKKFESTGVGVEDLVSIGTIGLIKAVNTFCPSRNIKLATYASRCIENEILMYLRKSSNQKNEVSIDEPLNTDWDGNELLLSDVLGTDADSVNTGIEKDVERSLLRSAIARLSGRERTIMEMRFGLNDNIERTQKEVADMLGISQSYISRLEKRIIARLRRDIERAC
jgi:RNA polymerase sporulation-specific sigma factor